MALQTVNMCADSNLNFLACALSYVLIQNDQSATNCAHQRALTYSTRLLIASVQQNWRNLSAALSLQSKYSSWMLCCGEDRLDPFTEFWVQHHIQMGNEH